jgi:type I restriction enzyme S subunit
MVDVDALRNKVLDIAIQGKLATNDINELSPNIPDVNEVILDEDKRFDIPNNWRWAKIGWVMDIERGGSPRPIKAFLTDAKNGINWIKIGDVEKNGKYILHTKEKIKPEGEPKSRRVYPGDFLLTNSMSFGRPYISRIEGCVHDGWLILRNTEGLFYYDFLYYLLSSHYMYEQFCKRASGSTVDNLNIDKVANAVVPIPPIDEQMRIVEQIEKIFDNISIISENQRKYTHDLEVLKNKLIDAGIKGNLTEQLPEDGTAEELYAKIQMKKNQLINEGKIKKEKALPEITNEEIPFEIPRNWKWVRWGNLSESIQYGYNAPAKSEGRIKMVRISDIQENKVLWDNVPYCDIEEENIDFYLLHENDILFARTGGTVGKSYIVSEIPEEAVYAGYLIRTSYSSMLCTQYMKYFMESSFYWKQLKNGTIATAQPNCNGKTLAKMILPLPPLSEQKRIVDKLNQLFEFI